MALERWSDDYDHKIVLCTHAFLGISLLSSLHLFSENHLHDSNDARIARVRILFRKL